ncbi:hypothetical protein DSO57_1012659 [Entomophthora muscae]|uniref:Uncharacterized protein n=1 Tax=Entomophthora muscae TaxID=34485 RepID=A0ACC2RWX7_9FUNG|nr:hypothetical protein DSO57_1012659 [Entomophthora muscae]
MLARQQLSDLPSRREGMTFLYSESLNVVLEILSEELIHFNNPSDQMEESTDLYNLFYNIDRDLITMFSRRLIHTFIFPTTLPVSSGKPA